MMISARTGPPVRHARHHSPPNSPGRRNTVASNSSAVQQLPTILNSRAKRLERLRQMSTLRQKAAAQRRVEEREADDFTSDLRYSSSSLEGMLLRIPSSSTCGGSCGEGRPRTARHEIMLEKAKGRVAARQHRSSRRRSSSEDCSDEESSIGASGLLFRSSSSGEVSSLGASKFTDTDDIGDDGDVLQEDIAAYVAKAVVPALTNSTSFEQIQDDIDNFEREAALQLKQDKMNDRLVGERAAAAATATANASKIIPIYDEAPALTTTFSSDDSPDDEISLVDTTTSSSHEEELKGVPHLLASFEDDNPDDETSETAGILVPSDNKKAPSSITAEERGDTYEEFGGMYHTPDSPVARERAVHSYHQPKEREEEEEDAKQDEEIYSLERGIAATGSTSPMSVAAFEQDQQDPAIEGKLCITKLGPLKSPPTVPREIPATRSERVPSCYTRREKSPVNVRKGATAPKTAAPIQMRDTGELRSLSPHTSFHHEEEEEDGPFDISKSQSSCSSPHSSFIISISEAEETPFDEDCGRFEETPFDECPAEESPQVQKRSISPLSHPYPSKQRPSAAPPKHCRNSSAVSDLAYSLPDNDLIIDFDPVMIGKNISVKGIYQLLDEDPTFMESLTYTKSEGRVSPATNGKVSCSSGRKSPYNSRAPCFLSDTSASDHIHQEDEPSI